VHQKTPAHLLGSVVQARLLEEARPLLRQRKRLVVITRNDQLDELGEVLEQGGVVSQGLTGVGLGKAHFGHDLGDSWARSR